MVQRAHDVVKTLMGVVPSSEGGGGGEVILGASTTQLCATLAGCFLDASGAGERGKDSWLGPGDEVVVHRSGHEANIGPWVRLAARAGATLAWWGPGPSGEAAPLDALRSALTPRTKILAVCHVSNLLGEIADLPAIVAAARELAHPECQVVVDGVAYAPHRAMSVSEWGVDWYCFSVYKVYGPHCAAMYGASRALSLVTGPNHFFIDPKDVPYKFELGGVSHEACAGVVALGGYLGRLATGGGGGTGEACGGDEEAGGEPGGGEEGGGGGGRESVRRAHDARTRALTRSEVETAFDVMTALEAPTTTALMRYFRALHERGAVRLIGPASDDPDIRVPTVSFVPLLPGVTVHDVVAAAHGARVAIRNGNMYGVRLCEDLGVDPAAGVVRVSLVYYNTVSEVARLVRAMEGVFGAG